MFNYVRAHRITSGGALSREAALLPMTVQPVTQQEGQFDLALELTENDEALDAELRYSLDLFEARTARGVANLYRDLLEAVATDPDAALSQLPGMDEGERRRLLEANTSARLLAGDDVKPGDGLVSRAIVDRPATPIEALVSTIYADVLGIAQVTPDD